MEKTLVVIKPDGVKRNLIGKIINYYEEGNLKVSAMKMLEVSKELIEQHYKEDPEYMESLGKKGEQAGEKVDNYIEYGRIIVKSLRDYLTMGPVVAMVLEGDSAITNVRKISGYTNPAEADKGTIRGDLGEDDILTANREKRSVYNLVHASGNPEEAEYEIALWFGK